MCSCFGGGGLGGVILVLNPQVTSRITGILDRDIIDRSFDLGKWYPQLELMAFYYV